MGMRIAGLVLCAAVTVTLIVGMAAVCCADEDGCSGFCACVCCGHCGFCVDSSTAADGTIDAGSVLTEVTPILVSLPLSPDFRPPEV
jgi:hypothetical protein